MNIFNSCIKLWKVAPFLRSNISLALKILHWFLYFRDLVVQKFFDFGVWNRSIFCIPHLFGIAERNLYLPPGIKRKMCRHRYVFCILGKTSLGKTSITWVIYITLKVFSMIKCSNTVQHSLKTQRFFVSILTKQSYRGMLCSTLLLKVRKY